MYIASTSKRGTRDSGHLLLAVLLVMALMIIAAVYEAPRIVQQMKRDREEEMIHRGTEYARAIKKFYKKFGRYPTSLEQLENTNNIRFLRKRYKDPLKKDGKWTLLHYGDIAMMLNANGPGVSAAALASGGQGINGSPAGQGNSGFGQSRFGSSNTPQSSGGFGTSNFGSNPQASPQGGMFNQQPQSGFGQSGFGQSSGGFGSSPGGTSGASSGFGTSASSAGSGTTAATGTGATSTGGDQSGSGSGNSTGSGSSSTLGQVQGVGGQFGGGAIVGVASTSKDPTIRVYNKKKTYNEWQFIYNPQMDQQNALLRGPYSPSALIGNTNIGTPAGNLNQQNQQSPFGQSGGFGNQQQSGFGSQQPSGSGNQTLTPGGQQSPHQ